MVTESSLLHGGISNPENKRRYEEEITQLEKDRGTDVQFIHPEAHHVLKTRGAGEKRFINICSNQLIDKPSCEAGRGRGGKAGYNWCLPFSLTPGRPDRDAAGNRCVIYDVIFHPDALHAAETNKRLMELLHSTAVGGVEDSFHIKLDKGHIKQLKMKYKGVPQAYRSVIDLEIVITVALPLLRSAQDAEVRVQERRLVLESQKPAYKLDLPLSYPVDEDKGDAKFNKTKKELTITLPVQPIISLSLFLFSGCDIL
uniref:PIH1 domain-containing protein 2 n=1 Tax=Cyprinus carpio TaxID=7962 RepID=A0A8C1KB98_CYPCA